MTVQDQLDAPTPPTPRGKPRQAVVIIHGIGEQRPMDTLRTFVLGILGEEKDAAGKRLFYSKPDPNAEGFEERRYRAFDDREDSDFIELYWQHLMPIAAWRFILSWLWLLMRRPVKDMPSRFVFLWWTCWGVFAVLAAMTVYSLVTQIFGHGGGLSLPKLTGLAAIAIAAAGGIVRAFVGDVAIYLNPHPRTVESRNKIRQAGVDLLARLHADGRYDRIIVVGHSLGSMIGYDILNFSWQRESEALRRLIQRQGPAADADQPRLREAEMLASTGVVDVDVWRQAVRNLHYEQRRVGSKWLVTDFVTLGSPLAHSRLLLAKGKDDFDRRVEERELPSSPPFLEDGTHFSYERKGPTVNGVRTSGRVVDHAAVFGVTVWTNLYFPCRHLLYGDLVGGVVAPIHGEGVRDRAVVTGIRKGWLAHTEYWTRFAKMPADASPLVLREVLDLPRAGLRRPAENPPELEAPTAQ